MMENLMAMAEGNPGTASVLAEMIQRGGDIDPQDWAGGFGGVMELDTLGVYGPRVWMLYKDVCGENLVKTLAVLRAVQLGKLSPEAMNHAIDNYGDGLDVEAILTLVKEELEEFDRNEKDNI